MIKGIVTLFPPLWCAWLTVFNSGLFVYHQFSASGLGDMAMLSLGALTLILVGTTLVLLELEELVARSQELSL